MSFANRTSVPSHLPFAFPFKESVLSDQKAVFVKHEKQEGFFFKIVEPILRAYVLGDLILVIWPAFQISTMGLQNRIGKQRPGFCSIFSNAILVAFFQNANPITTEF